MYKKIYELNCGKLINCNSDDYFWNDIHTVRTLFEGDKNTFVIEFYGDRVSIPIDFSISEAKITKKQILKQFFLYRRLMPELESINGEEWDWNLLKKLRVEYGLITKN